MTDAELFTAVGETLFGRSWKAEMSAQLDVTKDVVRHWANGRSRIPPSIWRDVAQIVESREIAFSAVCALVYRRVGA